MQYITACIHYSTRYLRLHVLIGNLPWLDDVYMLLATDHASQVAKCKKEKVHPQPQKLRHSKISYSMRYYLESERWSQESIHKTEMPEDHMNLLPHIPRKLRNYYHPS